jgi:hypothetical protein
MAHYSGRAVVTDHHGEHHDIRANLTSYPAGAVTGWRGTLSGEAPWWDMLMARGEYVLRIGDRQGIVVLQSVGGRDAIANAVVAGSGPVPFD